MSKISLIIKREYLTRIRKKSFIIMSVSMAADTLKVLKAMKFL